MHGMCFVAGFTRLLVMLLPSLTLNAHYVYIVVTVMRSYLHLCSNSEDLVLLSFIGIYFKQQPQCP